MRRLDDNTRKALVTLVGAKATKRIAEAVDSPRELFYLTSDQVRAIAGAGAAAKLEAAQTLVDAMRAPAKNQVRTPDQIAKYMADVLGKPGTKLWALPIGGDGTVIKRIPITEHPVRGDIIRDVIRAVVPFGGKFYLVRTFPEGTMMDSPQGKIFVMAGGGFATKAAEQIKKSCGLVGLDMVDYLVVYTPDNWWCMYCDKGEVRS